MNIYIYICIDKLPELFFLLYIVSFEFNNNIYFYEKCNANIAIALYLVPAGQVIILKLC